MEGGQDQGVVIANPLFLIADEEGLYWIDVLFEDSLITRVPLRVIFAALQTMQLPHPPQP